MEIFNEHLSVLVGRYVPTKLIRVRNRDKPWFDDQCRRAFDLNQEAHLRWTRDRSQVNWEEFVHCQVRANETYSEAKHQFSVRNIDVLMNVQSPHKWWSTPKSTVFGSGSSLPPLVGPGGGLVCESVGKADLLSEIIIIIILESSVQGRERMRTLYQFKDPNPTQPTHGKKKKIKQ